MGYATFHAGCRAKIDKLEQLTPIFEKVDKLDTQASQKQSPYVLPHARRPIDPDTRSFDGELKEEQDINIKGHVLTTTGIHQIYGDSQAASHGDQKLNLLEFNWHVI